MYFYYINYISDETDEHVVIHCKLPLNLPLPTSATTSAIWNMTTMKMEEIRLSNEGIDTGY